MNIKYMFAFMLLISAGFTAVCSVSNQYGTFSASPCESYSMTGFHSQDVNVTSAYTATVNVTFNFSSPVDSYSLKQLIGSDWTPVSYVPEHIYSAGRHYYTFKNVPFTANAKKQFKLDYAVPFNESGKYDVYFWTGSYSNPTIYLTLDPWFNSSFQRRTQFNITAADTFETYFMLNSTNFNMSDIQTNCSDLRFTQNNSGAETEVNYWIETCNTSGNSMIWLNKTVNNTMQFYAYYKNATPVQTTADGVNVFMFFDTFDGSVLNTTKWVKGATATANFSNSIMNHTTSSGWGCIYSAVNYTSGVSAKIRIKGLSNTQESYFGFINTSNGYQAGFPFISGTSVVNGRSSNAGGSGTQTAITFMNKTEYRVYQVSRNATVTDLFNYENGNQTFTHNTSILTTPAPISMCAVTAGSGAQLLTDWAFVSKYSALSPGAVVFSSAETLDITPPAVINVAPANNSTFTVNASNASTALLNFTYNVTDANVVSNCSLVVNNSSLATNASITKSVNQTFLNANVTANQNMTWYVNCTDEYGNTNGSIAWSFYYNTTNYTTAAANGTTVNVNVTVNVGGTTTNVTSIYESQNYTEYEAGAGVNYTGYNPLNRPAFVGSKADSLYAAGFIDGTLDDDLIGKLLFVAVLFIMVGACMFVLRGGVNL